MTGAVGSPADGRPCWCGAVATRPFGCDYLQCETCGSLVVVGDQRARPAHVTDDDNDFYGKRYWLEHQRGDLGSGDIFERARSDLPERALHWLDILLEYRAPGDRVLEIGCGHGGFVALLRWAGLHAAGVEVSPWVVDYARRTFGIEVMQGPVESLPLEPSSQDAIVLMDVVEHLPDPAATIAFCAGLLKPSGLLLVQMPRVPQGQAYEALVARDDPFLHMLQPDEHLFLFGDSAAAELMRRAGLGHVHAEPALFAHYDMCFVASREAIARIDPERRVAGLLATPGGRVVQALLDLRAREGEAQRRVASVAADIVFLKEKLALPSPVAPEIAEAAELRSRFAAAEADRVERGRVIEAQGREVSSLQAMVDAHLRSLAAIQEQLELARNERNLAAARLEDRERQFAFVEEDRAARGRVIEDQGRSISTLQAAVDARLREIGLLQAAVDAGQGEVAALHERLEAARNDCNLLAAQRDDLRRQFEAVEADREARGRVIEEQGRVQAELHRTIDARLKDLEALVAQVEALDARRGQLEVELSRLRDEQVRERAAAESEAASLRAQLSERDAATALLESRLWFRVGRFFRRL